MDCEQCKMWEHKFNALHMSYVKHMQLAVNPPMYILPEGFKFSPGAINTMINATFIRKEPWLIKLIKWWRGR